MSLPRSALVYMVAGILTSCAEPTRPPGGPVEGTWRMISTRQHPLEPYALWLRQNDDAVTGTGSAMGVDVPIPIEVSGLVDSGNVNLHLMAAGNGTEVGTYTARLVSPDTLAGRIQLSVVYGGQADTLTYVRQIPD